MNKQKIVIFILSAILFILAEYIIINDLYESNQTQVQDSYQIGYDKGLSDTAESVFLQTENCNPVGVTLNNMTKVIIDTACLDVSPMP